MKIKFLIHIITTLTICFGCKEKNTFEEKENLISINVLKEFNVQEQSKKIKVIANKTFFHTEMSEASKRKAFLVQGDIAYLEDIHEDWVKVYYDGKIVSGGYIKKSDVEVF